MVHNPETTILNIPDDLEREKQRATEIIRGRRLTILVMAIAVGGAILELMGQLLETDNSSGIVTRIILLAVMAAVCYLLYQGNDWGKRGVAGYLAYSVLTGVLALLMAFLSAAQTGELGSSPEVLLGFVIGAVLIGGASLAVPVIALLILYRSKSVARFLTSQLETRLPV